MNPSFKPPPPVSDGLRNAIYKEFMKDPVNNNVRALSQRYHLSLKRVDAILRLKGMEEAWEKVSTTFTLITGVDTRLPFNDDSKSISL
jgi:hypothetical protein